MDILSSSSLKKHAPTHSPPLLVLKFKISSHKVHEKCDASTHQRSNISFTTRTTSLHQRTFTALITSRNPSTSSQQKSKETTRTKKQSFLTTFFNSLDTFICNFLDSPLRPSIDPKHVLSGNFAPVDELPPTPCDVIEGSIPQSLNGVYTRNGPNPQFKPRGPHHLFDGDGMLHAITISDGKATLCSRFVKTQKYTVERKIGAPIFINVFSAFNGLFASLARVSVALGRILAGEYDPTRGLGRANTNLALIGGKLFALEESDLPYEVKITSSGDIITLGRHESFGENFMNMTAHPKIDMETGEAFAFRYSFVPPFLTYFRIDSKGIKQPEIPIFSLKKASLIHDFAISENYVVFNDTQIVFKLRDILRGKEPMSVDCSKVSSLGIIPRYAMDESEMWWVDVPGLNIMHVVNAWEEDGGDTIVMVAPNALPVEHVLDHIDLIHWSLERIEINVKEKIVTRRPVSTRSLEFAVINPAYVGKKNRYVYAAIGAPLPKTSVVVKLDLSVSTANSGECTVASRLYGPGCFGGEPFFVPREPDNLTAEEDDGYLITYIHNENSKESKFLVMDAKSPSLETIAVVKLPQRVPYGFHGIFLPDCHLQRL